MLGKRKVTAAALEVGKKPKNHGGKRQGTGPKPTPTNAPGSDAPGAPKLCGLLCSKLCRTPETFPATMRDGLLS